MNRIDAKFKELKENNEKALITFITGGYPDVQSTIDLVLAMEEAGADIIEIGIPYSDPLADGPVIQEASFRALSNGIRIKDIMSTMKSIREKTDVPIAYLVYYSAVFRYGLEKFITECRDAGVDGLIIPDLPVEENFELKELTKRYGICLIPLVTTTSKDRIKKITENANGFVYCVSTTGVTGERAKIETDIKGYMDTVSKQTNLPKALGFGISNAQMASTLKQYCDGIIIGSAIVKKVLEAKDKEEMLANVKRFVSEIKRVLI